MKRAVILLIKLYIKGVSPFFPNRCRFYPSCSQYSLEAVEQYGVLKGIYLSFFRVLRCHPFNDGGYNPVPGKE